MARCTNPNSNAFEYYGGRGIECLVTSRELMELYFRDKAHKMRRPSIDRIDSDGHYEPKNLRFVELRVNVRKAVRERQERLAKIRAFESPN